MILGAELGWLIGRMAPLFSRIDGGARVAHLSQSAAGTLLTALWQGVAIAACLLFSLRIAPRLSAALRFAILTFGFLAIAALPFLPMAIALSTHKGTAGAIAGGRGAVPWLTLDARWSVALTVLWACASLWRLGDLAVHSVRLRRLWKRAVPVETKVAFPALPGRRPIEICSTTDLEKPSVIGFLAPRILVPGWLLERMTPAELEQVALHETEHLRRGDDWTNLAQKLALVLFPLNPALLWLERRLCLEREMACDEGVVRRTRAPRAYAACLTSLAERGLDRRTQALSLGAWQRRPELARRVHSILLRKPVLKPAAARGLMAVLGCSLLAGSAELARCPQLVGFASAPVAIARVRRPAAQESLAQLRADATGDRVLRPELQPVVAGTTGTQAHMTELKATLPMRDDRLPMLRAEDTAARPLQRAHAGRFAKEREIARVDGGAADAYRAESLEASAVPNSLKAPQQMTADEFAHNHTEAGQPVSTQESGTEGWIVLTTWQQAESSSESAQQQTAQENGNRDDAGQGQAVAVNTADKVDPVAGDPKAAGSGPVPDHEQFTVTQVVFRVTQRVTQRMTQPPAATRATAQGRSDDAPPQPTIVPVRGGWIIFRL